MSSSVAFLHSFLETGSLAEPEAKLVSQHAPGEGGKHRDSLATQGALSCKKPNGSVVPVPLQDSTRAGN